MKMKKPVLSVLSLAVLILELLPRGVILRFANPERDQWVHRYSYFDLTPFGYANIGPFITAILTCVLILLIAFFWFKSYRSLDLAITIISGVAVVTSLLPIMFGFSYLTTIGVIITVLLISVFVTNLIKLK